VIRQPGRTGWQPGVAECGYCAQRFPFTAKPDAVANTPKAVFHRPRCPACKSLDISPYKTLPKDDAGRVVRYLRCEMCQARLKSIENVAGEVRIALVSEGKSLPGSSKERKL
jgi:hypothetical protein